MKSGTLRGGQRQKKNALYAGLLLKITWRQPPDLLRSSDRNRKRLIRDSNRVKTLCEGVERHGSNQNQALRVAFLAFSWSPSLTAGDHLVGRHMRTVIEAIWNCYRTKNQKGNARRIRVYAGQKWSDVTVCLFQLWFGRHT
jgi:hypothetical protein